MRFASPRHAWAGNSVAVSPAAFYILEPSIRAIAVGELPARDLIRGQLCPGGRSQARSSGYVAAVSADAPGKSRTCARGLGNASDPA